MCLYRRLEAHTIELKDQMHTRRDLLLCLQQALKRGKWTPPLNKKNEITGGKRPNVRASCVWAHVRLCVSMYLCMIIISPYLLRHRRRLKSDEWASTLKGSVGQLQPQQILAHDRARGSSVCSCAQRNAISRNNAFTYQIKQLLLSTFRCACWWISVRAGACANVRMRMCVCTLIKHPR